jgi:glycosyltransferase involved in cell wall biosynthesis/nucleotide-binding universal stress UspA family protein
MTEGKPRTPQPAQPTTRNPRLTTRDPQPATRNPRPAPGFAVASQERVAESTTVVPIIPGMSARTLIDVAHAMRSRGGKSVVLSVVEVPEERSLSEGVSVARRRREVLRRIGGEVSPETVEFAVRASRSFAEGVREAVREHAATHLVLGWRGPFRSEARFRRSGLESLVLDPPCDLIIFRIGRGLEWPPRRILVPIRGGLHAELALTLSEGLAGHFDAELTILRINRVSSRGVALGLVEADDQTVSLHPGAHYLTLSGESVSDVIAGAADSHDLLILGASARGRFSTHLFGALPELVADRVSSHVMIVKTAEPLSPEMFGVLSPDLHSVSAAPKASISAVVDRWFAENTFHSHEFEDLELLVRHKERQGLKISVALPALNEEATIGKIISTIKQRLVRDVPLVDELVVIDSDSKDGTRDIARELGVPVFIHGDILPEHGAHIGKGGGLWKSLFVTTGDIVVWIDSDITDIHPKFVYGLVGPLLTEPRVEFVKGYYRRPLNLGGELLTTGGGRVTELTARPLINLFYPQLSGLVQPLAGEMAGRRRLLEQLPFFTGYGVETGLLIDILERYGLGVIAQTDLENRVHRNQDMISLSKMAFGIVQVVMRRLEDRRHIQLLEEINTTMKLIHYSPEELFLEVKEIQERERPPIAGIAEYGAKHGSRLTRDPIDR